MSSIINQPLVPENNRITALEFYALGKVPPGTSDKTFNVPNKGIRSTSNDLLHRNVYSVNNQYFEELRAKTRIPATIHSQNISENDYLAPLKCYNTCQKFNLPTHMTNKETYNIAKEKLFAQDRNSSLQAGKNITKSDFIKEKQSIAPVKTEGSEVSKMGDNNANFNNQLLSDNVLVFDKNTKQMLRNKGFWIPRQVAQNKTKISKDAPDWFDVVPDWKVKKFNEELIKNEDTISVFSRYQNWITVTPKHKDRRHPLEKVKMSKKEATSKMVPTWMKLREKSHLEDTFKSIEYYPIKQKSTKQMAWVDKDLNMKRFGKNVDVNDNRSIFSLADFRHNLNTEEQARLYDQKVSQLPKKFFDWDDGKRFNPKYKQDV